MDVQIIQVPYDSGHKGVRTGAGPRRLVHRGVDQLLRARGHNVGLCRVESSASLTTEIGTTFELNRLLAEQVRAAIEAGRLPIVLAGNCNSCVGTIAGIGNDYLGVVWFDAHGDFNTPETTTSGFLDGMGLAMAAGHCWRSVLKTVDGFSPISAVDIVHIGSRDLDLDEEALMRESEVRIIAANEARNGIDKAVGAALDALRGRVDRVYVHVDMDVLDTGEASPNHLAVPGRLTVEAVEEAIGMIKDKFEVRACTVSSFDPDYDENDRVLCASFRVIEAFVA